VRPSISSRRFRNSVERSVADSPVDVYVNQKLVARGEVVVVEDRFGIKITEMIGKKV
jgi:hypothetical protein